ncbi:TIGR01244 family sulfur transferase [uncultured Roseovarius sp.]|uniref:TIGR01244 family sulfur transferase n=1 Tax=uncultured Roseovarius sp. TaxID=293344 RepID=UPI00261E6797|nr:TIGR01244 family sulfur transferase [uncultured Roseovarius sp.]
MDLRKITDDFTVSPQIEVSDIPAIVAAGYRSILCNRPDGEDPTQCCFEEVSKAALDAGLEVRSVPITSGVVLPDDLNEFRDALAQLPQPVLAYCRSGTRCTMLWTIAQFGDRSPEDILSLTRNAGYDMSGVLGQMSRS